MQGSEMALNSMNWSGAKQWTKAPRGLWVVEDQSAGYSKSHLGLEFVVVYNSGHLVPYNQPVHAFDLVTRFLQNKSFADHALPSFDFGYTATDKAGEQKVPSVEESLSV
jgi:carboxypeptidase C (cathepsin A)